MMMSWMMRAPVVTFFCVCEGTKQKWNAVISCSVWPFAGKKMIPPSWVMLTWDSPSPHTGSIFSCHLQLNLLLRGTQVTPAFNHYISLITSSEGNTKSMFSFTHVRSSPWRLCQSVEWNISSSGQRHRLQPDFLWFRWAAWLIRDNHTL